MRVCLPLLATVRLWITNYLRTYDRMGYRVTYRTYRLRLRDMSRNCG